MGFIAELIFVSSLKPLDNSVLIFILIWGSLPILISLLFIIKAPKILYVLNKLLIQTFAVVGTGIIFKINSIYIHPDPRGALALTTIPIIQIIMSLFIGLIIKIISKKHFYNNEDEIE